LTDKDVVAIEIGIDGTEEVGGESELLNNGRASIATTLRTVDWFAFWIGVQVSGAPFPNPTICTKKNKTN